MYLVVASFVKTRPMFERYELRLLQNLM